MTNSRSTAIPACVSAIGLAEPPAALWIASGPARGPLEAAERDSCAYGSPDRDDQ